MRRPWNANIHYDATLANLVPAQALTVLDVGCGDGLLAARLADSVPYVVGLDSDAPVLARAQARFPETGVHWRQGDVLRDDDCCGWMPPTAFDVVLSNATLHHLVIELLAAGHPDVTDRGDPVEATASALRRLGSLVAPGGTLGLVGFACNEPRHLPYTIASFVALGLANRARRKWEHSAPQAWPPPFTYTDLRQAAAVALPGARIRRLLLGRWLLVWNAPGAVNRPLEGRRVSPAAG